MHLPVKMFSQIDYFEEIDCLVVSEVKWKNYSNASQRLFNNEAGERPNSTLHV